MPFWLPSIPYPALKDGYWEPVTSTLDWCEENYYATPYAAEIVNTLTNTMFLYLGIRGIRNCIKEKHPTIFLVSFAGYLLVGTGSFLFHASLKYPMQLWDELGMIYSTCVMVLATFGLRLSDSLWRGLTILLVTLALSISFTYHYLQDPLFHQNAYALLTAAVLLRAMYVMEVNLRPRWRDRKTPHTTNGSANGSISVVATAEKQRTDDRDLETLGLMWTMIAYGLSIFLGGFAIWNLDNIFCSNLRRWRHDLGLPWGMVLEGHGWWHLMTGIGAYFYIVWGVWLRHCLEDRQDEYTLRWPSTFTSFPDIVRVERGDKSKKP